MKQFNFQGTKHKPLSGSESVESRDIETDSMIANLKLVDIYKKI